MGLIDELRQRYRHRNDPYTCQEAVELVTDYVEGSMTPDERERFERHLHVCAPCVRYVEQVRVTVDAVGRVRPDPPDDATRNALLDAFRDFHRE